MVHIFFIVSGYVLSLKPLKQIRARQQAGLLNTLSSAIFRRGMRLYLPLYISVFFCLSLGCLGILEMEEKTLWTRMSAGLHALYFYSDFWNIANFTGLLIEQQLWTIPLEMAFSMILFMVIIGLSRVKPAARLAIVVMIAIYCLLVGQWAATEFLLGMFLAEVGLIRDSWGGLDDLSDLESASFLQDSITAVEKFHPGGSLAGQGWKVNVKAIDRQITRLRHSHVAKSILQGFFALNLICGLWLCGWPDKYNGKTPSWKYLTLHTPSIYADKGTRSTQFFWHCIGAFLIVSASQQFHSVQALLNTRVPQYLGKISYGLYLLHISFLKLFGRIVVRSTLYLVTGSWNPKGQGGGLLVWFLSSVILTYWLVWCADLFTRTVDVRCVKLARRIEQMFLLEDDNRPPA